MRYNKFSPDPKQNKSSVVSIIVTVILLAIIIVLIVIMIRKPKKDGPVNSSPEPGTPSAADSAGTPVPPTASKSTQPPASDNTAVTPTPAGEYDYAKPVPESAPVDLDYFKDAIFIGDSRMENFGLFSGIAGHAKVYTHVGATVNAILSDDPQKVAKFKVNNEELPLEEVLRKYNDFSKVYIMLGYNELGWPYPEQFVKYYVKLLDKIKEIKPGVRIYVECVIPVARQVTGIGVDPETENNENIAVFNRYIRQMCEEHKYYYLNVQEALVDSEGYLPDGASNDGIHPLKDSCRKWLQYIQCHVV